MDCSASKLITVWTNLCSSTVSNSENRQRTNKMPITKSRRKREILWELAAIRQMSRFKVARARYHHRNKVASARYRKKNFENKRNWSTLQIAITVVRIVRPLRADRKRYEHAALQTQAMLGAMCAHSLLSAPYPRSPFLVPRRAKIEATYTRKPWI